jgi:hypothetical protein
VVEVEVPWVRLNEVWGCCGLDLRLPRFLKVCVECNGLKASTAFPAQDLVDPVRGCKA